MNGEEMLNSDDKIMCGFADEIVSYIYDEIGTAERRVFEIHLAGCAACADEFAAVSNARFSVFEWQKEEFSHLLTPEIIIPYASQKTVFQENTSTGFFTGLRGFFSLSNLPITAAAALLLFLGIGFAVITLSDRAEEQIAANNEPMAVITPENQETPVSVRENPEAEIAAVPEPLENSEKLTPEIRSADSVENIQPGLKKMVAAATRSRVRQPIGPKTAVQSNKPPVLGNYEENVDRSLRLSDLFEDDIGAKR